MSHTTPAIAIAELQGQLADAKTEVADSLSYLTDCRTTVAASSFATVLMGSNARGTRAQRSQAPSLDGISAEISCDLRDLMRSQAAFGFF